MRSVKQGSNLIFKYFIWFIYPNSTKLLHWYEASRSAISNKFQLFIYHLKYGNKLNHYWSTQLDPVMAYSICGQLAVAPYNMIRTYWLRHLNDKPADYPLWITMLIRAPWPAEWIIMQSHRHWSGDEKCSMNIHFPHIYCRTSHQLWWWLYKMMGSLLSNYLKCRPYEAWRTLEY